MSFLNALERGTSPVDWCEINYVRSSSIAELVNTMTNIPFLLLPPILCKLFGQYAQNIDCQIYIIWTLFALVGVCSAYFHATLSLAGQLLDELAILWLLAFSIGMWFPKNLYPNWLNKDRQKFTIIVLVFSLIASFMALIYPWINSFALISLGIPTFVLLVLELKNCQIGRVRYLGVRCCICWAAAVVTWILDRMFCETWLSLNVPYLHGLWHILIALATYPVCVLFAYFYAKSEHDNLGPVIKYWPRDNIQLCGIPYIELKNI